MSDEDLIRRGDAFAVVKGFRLLEEDIRNLPAVTVGVPLKQIGTGLYEQPAQEHVNETPKTEHDAGNVLTPAPDAAEIREAALMTVPDEIELYYIIKASGAKKRIDVARAVSTHLEPMRRAILALITEKPHDRA